MHGLAFPQPIHLETAMAVSHPYLTIFGKCAILAAESNPDIARIKWVAIGEGTARACFQRGYRRDLCKGP